MIGANNPLNVRYSSKNQWLGQIGNKSGFCEFSSLEYGVRVVCIILMRSYRKRGLRTYAELITAFAPPSENDTQHYIWFVTDALDVFPFDVPVSSDDFASMIEKMSVMEGNYVSKDCILNVINDFKIRVYERKD